MASAMTKKDKSLIYHQRIFAKQLLYVKRPLDYRRDWTCQVGYQIVKRIPSELKWSQIEGDEQQVVPKNFIYLSFFDFDFLRAATCF